MLKMNITAGRAVAQQRRCKGFIPTPNKKKLPRYRENSWFNRGFNMDRKGHALARNDMRLKRTHDRTSMENVHMRWGPTKYYRFTDVTDMRKELDGLGNLSSGTPSPVHKNARKITGDDFDFKTVLNERGRFQPAKGNVWDAAEYVRAWNDEELKRLRGNDWHKKYYSGGFTLHSL